MMGHMQEAPSVAPSSGSKLRVLVVWTEAIYLCLLPFLGAIAAFYFHTDYVGWIVATGWLMAVLNMYIHLPMVLMRHETRLIDMLLPLVPMVLILVKQLATAGGLWAFLLDEAMLEAVALMVGFVWMFSTGKGVDNQRAWKSMGIGFTLIIVFLFGGCASGLILAWSETLPRQPVWGVANFGVAFFFAARHKVVLIRHIRDGGFNPDTLFNDNVFLILAPIFLWMAGLPLINWLMHL
jgi:hypothetical protein